MFFCLSVFNRSKEMRLKITAEADARKWLIFGSLVIVSLVLRLVRLDMGLWLDEIVTLNNFVNASWSKIITTLFIPNNHILFSTLAKISVFIFGEKEWSLRLPSVIIGSFTPGTFYLLFRKRFKEESAILASLFLVMSFWSVWFGQDARGYAGLILFLGLSHIFYLEWLEKNDLKIGTCYLVSAVVACYFHLYGIFGILSQIFYGFLFWLKNRKDNPTIIFLFPGLCLALGLALYSLGFYDLLLYSQKGGKEIQGRWLDIIFLKELLKMLSGSHYLGVAMVIGAIFLVGLYSIFKRWAGLCWLYLFSGVFVVIFTFFARVFIFNRFLSFLIPFFYLGVSEGLVIIEEKLSAIFPKLRKNALVFAFSGIICFFLIISLVRYYHLGKQGFKEVAFYLEKNYPERRVISFGVSDLEFLYYYPSAIPHWGAVPLEPQELIGGLLVGSHPWGWAPYNIVAIQRFCKTEKIWKSAGPEENTVYLYKCF